MKNILTITAALLFLGFGAFFFMQSDVPGGSETADEAPTASNVYMEGSVQVVEVQVKGGYSPRKSVARAGVPTVVRFVTNSTFDCSSAVRIPSLDISKNLSATGKEDIDLGAIDAGILHGSCGMGMYPFEIDFR